MLKNFQNSFLKRNKLINKNYIKYFSTSNNEYDVCIIGGGPAGKNY